MTLWQLSNGAMIDVEGTAQAFPDLGVLSEPKVMAAFGIRAEEGDPIEMLLKRIRSVDDPEVLLSARRGRDSLACSCTSL
jgi:hypothetical protein